MSFITKRERVFNEYDLMDLPSRNEDKSDHLVEIIKRNNETCRPKYIPTDVIVNTLMGVKNTEINRLRRKIEEFEQLLAAYDQLDLTSEQKMEIANNHAAIKAANKELDELCLDLDLSGYTEGVDSEAFETGKSRGDEVSRYKDFETDTSRGNEWSVEKLSNLNKETKSNQTIGLSCPCDASTAAYDPRIDEMQEVIISKDAKLNAMRNTIAVMENDVCEPYCIYAHIYTALEKIFGVLCQNEKYKQYLDLLTSGKDTRNVDIKGKILYKLKVFEKFCCALIAPCAQECSCYHAEIISRVETAFALTSQNNFETCLDSKRAKLVADIMESDEMEEILNKEHSYHKFEESSAEEDIIIINNCSIDKENLNRLKKLQSSYEDLLACYDELKYEKNSLLLKCQKYEELEKEYVNLRYQLNSYNNLWNEKEYHKKRSEDLDALKEKYLILTDETLNLETQLRAQIEINDVKSATVEQLRSENFSLENKLNEAAITFEKEKHVLTCRLKECECKMMCQNQQIESLTVQLNSFLGRTNENVATENEMESMALIDKIEAQKQEIKNLKDSLFYKDEEKQLLQNDYQEKLIQINSLKLEIEDWKGICEKTIQRNDYLEKLTEESKDELKKLIDENENLANDIEAKSKAIDNLMKVVSNKSLEIDRLVDEIDSKTQQNNNLLNQLHKINQSYDDKINQLENEKKDALSSLRLACQESESLISKICDLNDYDKMKEQEALNSNQLNETMKPSKGENELKQDLKIQSNSNSLLLNEIDRFRAVSVDNINKLLHQSNERLQCLELKEKESKIMEDKIQQINILSDKFDKLKQSHQALLEAKTSLFNDLQETRNKLIEANHMIQIFKDEKQYYINQLNEYVVLQENLENLKNQHEALLTKNNDLLINLSSKDHEIHNLTNTLGKLKIENQHFHLISNRVRTLEERILNLNEAYDNLMNEKNNILCEVNVQKDALCNLRNNIKVKTEENNNLLFQIRTLHEKLLLANNKIDLIEGEKMAITTKLNTIATENNSLKDNISSLENQLFEIKTCYNQLKTEKEKLEREFEMQSTLLKRLESENTDLQKEYNNLLTYNHDIENALVNTRNEQLVESGSNLSFHVDLKREVNRMKEQYDSNQKQIKILSEKLDQSNQIIIDLKNDILVRDDKISILDNQVNELTDEVQKLQKILATTIEFGEDINDSKNKIDESLKQMEAHHSKATHNMRIELGKLANNNLKLEQQLSATKIEKEETKERKDTFASEVVRLQYEKEIILTDIKQLEISCVGDSALSPDNCSVESILMSLEKIAHYIEARNNSSQLILSKADEAKRIVEKEKQKIVNEKEEAIKDKINMEKQLNILKENLQQQILKDKDVINDLEAELMNQKLIIDKINQSTQSYVTKLEEELKSLQNLYTKALSKIKDLEDKLQSANEENSTNHSIIKKMKMDLEEKHKDIKTLENVVETLKNKHFIDSDIQTDFKIMFANISTQTDNTQLHVPENATYESNNKSFDSGNNKLLNLNHVNFEDFKTDKNQIEQVLNNQPPTTNEVQILAANVEPSYDFVKNVYLHYKIKRLGLGGMEQYSVSCISDEYNSEDRQSRIASGPLSALSPRSSSQKAELIHKESYLQIPNGIDVKDSIVSSNKSNHNLSESGGTHVNAPNITAFAFIDKSNGNSTLENDNKNSVSTIDTLDESDVLVIYRENENDNKSTKYSAISEEKGNRMDHNTEQLKTKSTEKSESQNNDNSYEIVGQSEKKVTHSFSHEDQQPAANALYPIHSYALSAQLSPSETSLLNNLPNTQTKLNHLKQQKGFNGHKLSDYLVSHSFNSLISSEEDIKPKQENMYQGNSTEEYFNVSNSKRKFKTRIDLPVNGEKAKKKKIRNNENISDFGLEYILYDTKHHIDIEKIADFQTSNDLEERASSETMKSCNSSIAKHQTLDYHQTLEFSSIELKSMSSKNEIIDNKNNSKNYTVDAAVMVQNEEFNNHYKEKIEFLTNTLKNIDRDYKGKIRAIKYQYDNNIKNMINEHNLGVQSIQSLHEETLQDILKVHENETENLRAMSIDAMRKVDTLEKENKLLKTKLLISGSSHLDEEPIKMSTTDIKNFDKKCYFDNKTLTKTSVEEFNVKPKVRTHGPCTCSLDINLSDTIRNIFEQVDVGQRRLAEQSYLKYIANKILSGSIEALDAQELSFLHFKICRTWKTALRKEETLHKRIDNLETELMNKQRQTQKHIAELDRKVAEEKRRLQEVRDAVCRDSPTDVQISLPRTKCHVLPLLQATTAEKDITNDLVAGYNLGFEERLSAGDLAPGLSSAVLRPHRVNRESNRKVISGKMESEERRQKKILYDERPTRLRRSTVHTPNVRSQKK